MDPIKLVIVFFITGVLGLVSHPAWWLLSAAAFLDWLARFLRWSLH